MGLVFSKWVTGVLTFRKLPHDSSCVTLNQLGNLSLDLFATVFRLLLVGRQLNQAPLRTLRTGGNRRTMKLRLPKRNCVRAVAAFVALLLVTSPDAIVSFSLNPNTIRPLQTSIHLRDESIDTFGQNDPSSKVQAPRSTSPIPSFLPPIFLSAIVSASLLFFTPPAHASSYYALSDEQKLVAEAWRLVDNSFLDRTFNHQDWFALRQQYVQQQSYKSMPQAQNAISELVSSLGDPYTRYLNPSVYQSMVDSATGTFAGVGIEIARDDTALLAADVEASSPAAAAGIQPGDVFVQVDGYTFTDKDTPDDVAVRLRGPVGSKVGVVMRRNNNNAAVDAVVTRKPLTITAVKSYMANRNIGVIRIKNFSGTTAETVSKQWKDLKKSGAKTLVMDLRGNPGGLLPGGVDTAALFLDSNAPVVYVVNKQGIVDAQATLGPGVDLETPIYVLVDEKTASAAEVFTAALQENGRAVVVGHQTFGKGIVQTIRELSNKQGGLAITVARYETPSHKNINKQGIAVTVETPTSCAKDDATKCLTPSVYQTKPVNQV